VCSELDTSNPQFAIFGILGATGKTSDVLAVEPVTDKLNAFGFFARQINGNSIPEILDAFSEAKTITQQPYALVADTKIFAGIKVYQDAIPFAHFVGANGRWDAGYLEWEPGWQEIQETISRLRRELAAMP
ncbi:MAG: hypothetical protein OXC63_07435, partial [Aestuariivita sp.]|nr:hypothetical protein [Aestuariivita sp.]